MTPTARTLKLLREQGYTAEVVEHWIPYRRIRRDLWGLDIVALHPEDPGVLGVQCTTTSNLAARRHKLAALPAIHLWLATGNQVALVGWRKRKVKRGGKAYKWEPTWQDLTADALGAASGPEA